MVTVDIKSVQQIIRKKILLDILNVFPKSFRIVCGTCQDKIYGVSHNQEKCDISQFKS